VAFNTLGTDLYSKQYANPLNSNQTFDIIRTVFHYKKNIDFYWDVVRQKMSKNTKIFDKSVELLIRIIFDLF